MPESHRQGGSHLLDLLDDLLGGLDQPRIKLTLLGFDGFTLATHQAVQGVQGLAPGARAITKDV